MGGDIGGEAVKGGAVLEGDLIPPLSVVKNWRYWESHNLT